MFSFDLHVHSWYSADAADAPEKLIAAAKARGLHGIAITDHDTCEAHHYCLKNGLSRSDGLPVDGFLVVPGVEVSTAEGHLLCIGTTLPDRAGQPALDVAIEIHSLGGVAMPAHPYDRWRSGIPARTLDLLPIQAMEVFNSAVSSHSYNDKAAKYAAKRHLTGTANSDAHHATAVGVSYSDFDLPEFSVAGLLEALPKGALPHGCYLSKAEAFKKHFGNCFRYRQKDRPEI